VERKKGEGKGVSVSAKEERGVESGGFAASVIRIEFSAWTSSSSRAEGGGKREKGKKKKKKACAASR